MRLFHVFACLTAVLGYFASSASASTLFTSGPYNSTINGWDVSNTTSGPAPADDIADNFVLSTPAIVSGATFVVWANPGTTMTTVDYKISATPGGAALVSGTASVSQSQLLASSIYGYSIDSETFSITPTVLSTGTYWLELKNGNDGSSNLYYWDENDNPLSIPGLQAWDASLGGGPPAFLSPAGDPADCPSVNCTETFTITGTAVPEPGSFALLALLGVSSLFRRRMARSRSNTR